MVLAAGSTPTTHQVPIACEAATPVVSSSLYDASPHGVIRLWKIQLREAVGQLMAHHEAALLQCTKLAQAALALVIIDHVVLPFRKNLQ